MASLNKITIIGNVGTEPEMRFTPSGKAVTSFSVATNRTYTIDGERREETTWFKVTTWGKQAESCNQFLSKGSSVYVEGSIKLNQWDDKEGQSKASLEINASQVVFLSRKESKVEDDNESEVPF